jgi:hypothetical protein
MSALLLRRVAPVTMSWWQLVWLVLVTLYATYLASRYPVGVLVAGAIGGVSGLCLLSEMLIYILGANDWEWDSNVALYWLYVGHHGFLLAAGAYVAVRHSAVLGGLALLLAAIGAIGPVL